MYPINPTYFLSLLSLFIVQLSWGQIIHEGSPISWALEENILETTNIVSLAEPNLAHVLAVDLENDLYKNKPFHFASPILLPNSINLETSFGTWKTLINGDRIWTIIFTVPNALGLGVIFDEYHLPKDAKLFIYNEDHSALLGAYTSDDNTPSNRLITLPISGDKIIIEYFEPFEKIGDGSLSLEKVTYQYRDFDGMDMNICSQNAKCASNNINNQLNATVKIISSDGTRLGTGVLINDAANNDIPYILTSNQLNIGDPDTWQFIFNDYTISCDDKNPSDDYVSSIGASVVSISENTSTMLLKLNETPTTNWNIYFSGWNRDIEVIESAYSLHYSYGGKSQISMSTEYNQLQHSEDYIKNSIWNIGTTSTGAIGAPLFDDQGLLIGLFSSGNITCNDNIEHENTIDYFVLFSSLWEEYKTFLDPYDSNPISYAGKNPPIATPKSNPYKEEYFQIFPVPAKDFLKILNNDLENEITKIELINIQGQLLKTFLSQGEALQTIDLSEFNTGWFVLSIYSKQEVVRKAFLIE